MALLCLFRTLSAPGTDFQDAQARAEIAYSRGDYRDALDIWQPMAEAGDARAQFALGNAFERGQGVPPDIATAAGWYQRAAESGLPEAQFNLANLYLDGQGVQRDQPRAVALFGRAARQGYLPAQFNLAYAYDTGTGIEKDRAIAATWYARAAMGGSGDAMQRLAELRRDGVTPAALPALPARRAGNPPAQSAAPAPTASPGTPAVATGPGGWYLRLAAYRREALAERGWQVLRDQYPEQLSRLGPRLQAVDLGPEQGRFLRLLAGPLADESTALRHCQAIVIAGGDCIPQRLP